mmetsp:Transcript_88768/g.275968  ORF Transcript_88768/g.275968 Transcript_88768/m.275968 type:complete len:327 (+) Transcript_88768:318-1298(+)
MEGLHPDQAYYFQLSCRNSVGSSGWSDVATFWTRPSPPGRPEMPRFLSVKSREATFEWTAPDDYGSPIVRYEVLCARSRALMLWTRLIFERLWWVPSLHVIFGLFSLVDDAREPRDRVRWEYGRQSLVAYDAEVIANEAFCCEVDADQTSYHLDTLLPGKHYYAMVRAVSAKGNGKWSPITSMLTEPARPGIPQPVKVESVTSGDCTVSFSMPITNGKAIFEAVFTIERVEGPLADGDVDPGTGEPHPHHALREFTINPFATPLGSDHGEERFAWTIPGLLPGTEYEVSWACRNMCGLGETSGGESFTTKSGLPDLPESVFAADGF